MIEHGFAVRCHGVCRTFANGPEPVTVLDAVEMNVAAGEQVAVVGRSGAGKSTLLHVLGGLEPPDSGEVFVDGEAMNRLGAVARGRLRNRALGFIYQFHHLLPEFTALDNVAMPLLIAGMARATARERAGGVLEDIGLGERVAHMPSELSGGERQRVAIARALVTRPRCILADEPTGNLDRQTANRVFERFQESNRHYGSAVVMVTHDTELAERMDRIVYLDDGRISSER
jgi:lipoprotein-releasing system ATP-binding protein